MHGASVDVQESASKLCIAPYALTAVAALDGTNGKVFDCNSQLHFKHLAYHAMLPCLASSALTNNDDSLF